MLLSLVLPRINPHMTVARIQAVHIDPGAALGLGGKVLDLSIDLSAAIPHDCPPVSYFRLIARDQAWLRRLDVGPGAEARPDDVLALFSTQPDEPLDGAPARRIRLSVAEILPQATWSRA